VRLDALPFLQTQNSRRRQTGRLQVYLLCRTVKAGSATTRIEKSGFHAVLLPKFPCVGGCVVVRTNPCLMSTVPQPTQTSAYSVRRALSAAQSGRDPPPCHRLFVRRTNICSLFTFRSQIMLHTYAVDINIILHITLCDRSTSNLFSAPRARQALQFMLLHDVVVSAL
jgi:hypothetical protein